MKVKRIFILIIILILMIGSEVQADPGQWHYNSGGIAGCSKGCGHGYLTRNVTEPTCEGWGYGETYCKHGYTATWNIEPLGHSNPPWTAYATEHYTKCESCGKEFREAHRDNSKDGKCDACGYTTDNTKPTISVNSNTIYQKSHTATVTINDAGGAYLKTGTWTVNYAWTTSTATPSSYQGNATINVTGNVRSATTTIIKIDGNGTFYLHARITNLKDSVGNTATVTGYGRFNFQNDSIAPTISINSNTTYSRSQTATITFSDTGSSRLKADTYTLSYAWTKSTATPSTYSNNINTTTPSANVHTVTITNNTDTGICYLHVKLNKKVTDNAGNACNTTTLRGTFYLDNTKPTISVSSNATYQKSHTATVIINDTGGAYLKTGAWAVNYAWTTSTATPSSYQGNATINVTGNVRSATTTITKSDGNGTFYLHVRVTNLEDTVGNKATVTGYGTFNFDNTLPTISVNSDTTYKKSQTATITFSDTGGAKLKADTYTLSYAWTTSTAEPTTYSQSINTTSTAANTHTATITNNTDTGIYYLHVKLNKKVTDNAGNACENMKQMGTFYLDNTSPVINMDPISTITAVTKRNPQVINFKVIDQHAGINTSEFTADDIDILVDGKISTAQKNLTYVSSSNGEYRYVLTISNLVETGIINIGIKDQRVKDKAGNQNKATLFTNTNLYADNVDPTIALNGPITVKSIASGKNLSGIIDEQYINKEYEIEIPIVISDIACFEYKDMLDAEDIRVKVGNSDVTPTGNNFKLEPTIGKEIPTPIMEFNEMRMEYVLTLKNLTGDGYLKLNILEDAVTDFSDNKSIATELSLYVIKSAAQKNVYVDNTILRVFITDVDGASALDGNSTMIITLNIKENGSGIRATEFAKEDILVQINGENVNPTQKILTANSQNNYNTELGNGVPTNYTYTLALSGISENGTLRLEIPENRIIDKANNGNEIISLVTEVEIDNIGPKLGRIYSNADEQDEILGKPVIITIEGCVDVSGIEKYVWQRSKDKVSWETIKTDNTMVSTSKIEQEYDSDNIYYYRVIVSDTLGNESISDIVKVHYKNYLGGMMTIRLKDNQISKNLIEIEATIKSRLPIKKVTVNGIEIPTSNYKNNVTFNNYEHTTVVKYNVTVNGVYEFMAEDESKNSAKEIINISTFDATTSQITYEKYDVSILGDAKIIFKSDEPIMIDNPNNYSGITFKETGFATVIEAIISPDEEFITDRTFNFDNKGMIRNSVVVKAPIITKLGYVRFSKVNPANINATLGEIGAMVGMITTSKSMGESGKITSYYGFEKNNINVEIANRNVINLAEKMGRATETFSVDKNNQKARIEKNSEVNVQNNVSYTNGNISGMYKKTSGLLDNFVRMIEDTNKYGTFRIVIRP